MFFFYLDFGLIQTMNTILRWYQKKHLVVCQYFEIVSLTMVYRPIHYFQNIVHKIKTNVCRISFIVHQMHIEWWIFLASYMNSILPDYPFKFLSPFVVSLDFRIWIRFRSNKYLIVWNIFAVSTEQNTENEANKNVYFNFPVWKTCFLFLCVKKQMLKFSFNFSFVHLI